MNAKQAKNPQLRFSGFTDPWEQRKLGEVADIIGGGTPSTNVSEYWNGDIDWYSPVEIGNQIYIDESQKKITGLGLQKSSAHILPVGTVLFTSRAGIGNTAILAKEGCTNQGFQSIVPYKDLLNSYFIFSRTSELKRYGEINGAGSTFIEVSGKQMAKMPISVPSIEEQQKIGAFFKQLDNTITLHQRKLAKLKELKQGYLQKLFPKNGSKIPELRFKGFDDAWEERKLGEVATLSSSKRIHLSDYVTEGIPFYRGSEISTGGITGNQELFISKEKFDEIKEKYGVPSEGDLLVTAVGTLGNLWKVDSRRFYYKDGNLIQISKMQVNSDYLLTYFTGGIGKKRLRDSAAGSNQKALTMVKMREITVDFPSEDEQQKIGSFFKQLDDTIALHQRKLEKLQELKKGYLQKMFC